MVVHVPPVRKALQGAEVMSYPSRATNASDRLLAARLFGGIVLRGEDGVQDALRLYADGWNGSLRIDPAGHERPHSAAATPNLFGQDPWLVDEQRATVAEFLSPGTYVPACNRQALVDAIAVEDRWLVAAGSGRMSLALDWEWLTLGLRTVVAELGGVRLPLALAFGDPKDPMAHPGAVRGLVSLLSVLPDVMLLRGDMAAFGAIANGAVMAAVGTGTSVRHVVPPGKAAGGGRTGIPSLFCEQLLDWKRADRLARLPARLRPACLLACCKGATLDRFVLLGSPAEARVHNLVALANFANRLLKVQPSLRDVFFKQACQAAVRRAGRIEVQAKQPFPPRPQLAAWAAL